VTTRIIHGVECEVVRVSTNAAPVRELIEELGYAHTICGACPNRVSAVTIKDRRICDACDAFHVYIPATLAPIFKLRIES
jgi:hypothetical protein